MGHQHHLHFIQELADQDRERTNWLTKPKRPLKVPFLVKLRSPHEQVHYRSLVSSTQTLFTQGGEKKPVLGPTVSRASSSLITSLCSFCSLALATFTFCEEA